MSLILQMIGGSKLGKVGSVFAEGKNITKQLSGGIGADSFTNKIPMIGNLMQSGGLSSVFSNPMSTVTNLLSSNISGGISSIGSITKVVTTQSATRVLKTGQTTVVPAYPLFTAALQSALVTINNYSRLTELLSGRLVPDYTVNEYGLSEVLSLSSSGSGSLTGMTAPLNMQTQVNSAVTAINSLILSVQSANTANAIATDTGAVSQLNSIMQPIVTSMNQASSAYNSGSGNIETNTLVNDLLTYVGNSDTPNESAFVSSLLIPQQSVPDIIAHNNYKEQPDSDSIVL